MNRSGLLLGRASDCDVPLDFAEVSRRHAEITFDGSALVIRDLSSTNGTYVNGRRISACSLHDGSVIRIGTWLGVTDSLTEAELGCWCAEVSPGLWGGTVLQRALEPLRAVAQSNLPIVLVGDTGTGKERFAAAIHRLSERSGALHAVNCAAMPTALAESQLFGHERGAFTGAETKTHGHFRAADRGTLFLDELQDLPLSLQAKVLRAVELKIVTPLGGTRSFEYDARIVVASQRPLSELVTAGRFRPDLAMRLSGLTVLIPSLEQRRSDVPSLFAYFLREHASGGLVTASAKFYERLCLYGWPGNVRELELLARRMLALHRLQVLSISELPDEYAPVASGDDSATPYFATRDEEDRHLLKQAIGQTGGNLKRAAKLSNLSRARAYRLLGKRSTAEEDKSE
ncbi:MAG: sigma 54-interacting transcriptional regulator [Polyangiaceae bacterium]